MSARFIITSTLLCILKINTAVAETNAMDGSFRYSLDFKDSSRSFTLTYNSRSLHEGVFGLGWCASFEKKAIYRYQQHWLIDCNLPKPQKITAQRAQRINQTPVFVIPSSIRFQVKNIRLISLQGGSQNLKFQYDESSNLSVIQDITHQKTELIRYDHQDRVISHHHPNLCFDQFQYQKQAQNLYMTEVTRSCPSHPKENFRYAFSLKKNRRSRQISSIKVTRYSDAKQKKTDTVSALP